MSLEILQLPKKHKVELQTVCSIMLLTSGKKKFSFSLSFQKVPYTRNYSIKNVQDSEFGHPLLEIVVYSIMLIRVTNYTIQPP